MSRFRRVTPAEFERYQAVLDYAFAIEDGPQTYDDGLPDRMAERWGLFEDDDLRSTCGLYGLDARVRGKWTDLGGLAAVATPPEYRRQGHVRALAAAALREYRDRGIGWVALWPFEHTFYEQFGWATANKTAKFEFDPAVLSVAADYDDGTFEQVGPDDWHRLREVQLAHGEGTTLSLRRSEDWWRERVFDHWGATPYVYAWRRGSEVRGYVAYVVDSEEGDRTLKVTDYGAVDHEAFMHLLWLLYTHESQVSTVRLHRCEESKFLDIVDDPQAVDCTVSAGPMIRLGDVRSALSRLSYPDDISEQVVIDVEDPLVDHNDITVSLTVSDEFADCSWSKRLPDGTIDVGTLSQLAIGYLDAEQARRFGGLDADDDLVDALGRLFPPERVRLREFF